MQRVGLFCGGATLNNTPAGTTSAVMGNMRAGVLVARADTGSHYDRQTTA